MQMHLPSITPVLVHCCWSRAPYRGEGRVALNVRRWTGFCPIDRLLAAGNLLDVMLALQTQLRDMSVAMNCLPEVCRVGFTGPVRQHIFPRDLTGNIQSPASPRFVDRFTDGVNITKSSH
jgi:hypothetical protein